MNRGSDETHWIDGSSKDWEAIHQELREDIVSGSTGQSELRRLLDAESGYGEACLADSRGFMLQIDGLQALWMETIARLAASREDGHESVIPGRAAFLIVDLVALLRVFRQSQRGFFNGYGIESIPQLRSIIEFAFGLAGDARGICTLEDLEGSRAFAKLSSSSGTLSEQSKRKLGKESARLRMAALSRVKKDIEFGSVADLNEVERLDWRSWIDNFNLHAHGSQLSRSVDKYEWITEGQPPLYHRPFSPDDKQTAYVNTCLEAAWLLHRVLPLCQQVPSDSTSSWAKSWRILDEAFQSSAHARVRTGRGYWNMLGKVVGQYMGFAPSLNSIDDLDSPRDDEHR